MNKSELELQNIQSIIDEMPVAERALCVSMVSSLMASVGNPVYGRTFMIAVAFTNCQVAVHNIKMGLVNSDGSIPEKFMQGDGKVKYVATVSPNELLKGRSFIGGGFVSNKLAGLIGERASDQCMPLDTSKVPWDGD